jgi:hypothetical protein
MHEQAPVRYFASSPCTCNTLGHSHCRATRHVVIVPLRRR